MFFLWFKRSYRSPDGVTTTTHRQFLTETERVTSLSMRRRYHYHRAICARSVTPIFILSFMSQSGALVERFLCILGHLAAPLDF